MTYWLDTGLTRELQANDHEELAEVASSGGVRAS